MEKPGIFYLTKQATDFFAMNRAAFWQDMKTIAPIGALILFATHAGSIFHYNWLSLAMLFPMVILQAHFYMRWSRRSMGIDLLSGFDGKFMLSFFGLLSLAASPSILFAIIVVLNALQGTSFDVQSYLYIVRIATVASILMAFRLAFVLPSRAAKEPCGLTRAWTLAKGLWWKIAAGFIIFLLLLFVTFLLYSGSIGVVIMGIGADTSINNIALLFVSTILSIPVFLGVMVMIAFVSTMISRAYEYALLRERAV